MDADDNTLETELHTLLRRIDAVPADVTLAARSALAWRRMDAELAQLLDDTSGDRELAATRGSDSGWRALTFEAPTGVTIEVEVLLDGVARTVIGQVLPAAGASVALRHAKRHYSAVADDLGRFRFDSIPSGPVSLRVEHVDGPVETGWVTI